MGCGIVEEIQMERQSFAIRKMQIQTALSLLTPGRNAKVEGSMDDLQLTYILDLLGEIL